MTGGTLSCEEINTQSQVITGKKRRKNGQSLTLGGQTAEDLEEGRGVEQSAIPTEADDEVHAVGNVIKICERRHRSR